MFKLLAIVAVCCIQAAFCADVCPCGWTNVGNKCCKFFATQVTWDVARASCQENGGDLVIISNLTESNLLATEAKKRGLGRSWTGYFRPRYQPNKFLTVCGVTATYLNWAPGEPNNAGGQENCAMVYTEGNNLGKWNDGTCTRAFHYICEFNYDRC